MKRDTLIQTPEIGDALFDDLVTTVVASGTTPGDLADKLLARYGVNGKVSVEVKATASTVIAQGKQGKVCFRPSTVSPLVQLFEILDEILLPGVNDFGDGNVTFAERVEQLREFGLSVIRRVGDDAAVNTFEVLGRTSAAPSGGVLPNLSGVASILDPRPANRKTLKALVDSIIDASSGPVKIMTDGSPTSNPGGIVVVADMAAFDGANLNTAFGSMAFTVISADWSDTMTVSGDAGQSVDFDIAPPPAPANSGASDDPANFR